ncbi:MAG: hypothetical protein H0W13_03425 [Nitrospirales bacterium]|nr:hypothetical protein [Nitrospirales bacterium]
MVRLLVFESRILNIDLMTHCEMDSDGAGKLHVHFCGQTELTLGGQEAKAFWKSLQAEGFKAG